jgi:hypothetical protein
MMSDSETNQTDGNLMFPNQVVEVVLQSMGTNLLKSPAIRLLTRSSCGDNFSLLDCAARTQAGAKQSGRLRGVVETTFSRRIASHSPFDWTGNCTGLPQRRNGIKPSVSG